MRAVSILVIVFASSVLQLSAQPQNLHPGVVLFKQAKFSEAIRSLEHAAKSKEYRSDAEIWNYLGLAHIAKDEIKKGRKAFERSVALNPASSVYHANLAYAYLLNRQINKAQKSADKALQLDSRNGQAYHVRSVANSWEGKLDPAERDADAFIEADPTNADAYLLKSEILLAKLGVRVASGHTIRDEVTFLERAVDTLTQGVARAKGHPRYPELESELQSITVFHKRFSRDPTVASETTPPSPDPDVKPIRILSKPQASYTDRARTAGISGTVRIVALFGTSGKVEHVLVVKRLGYGLDQQAVSAAKKIKFEPKMKGGKPVPVVLTLEYSFTIY